MAKYLLKQHVHDEHAEDTKRPGPLGRFQRGFEARFEKVRSAYRRLLELAK